MRTPFLFLSALLLLETTFVPLHTVAYEIDTHAAISDKGADQSENLTASLPTLGLMSLDDDLVFLPAQGAVMSARKWIQFGVQAEDDRVPELGSPVARFRHHFYNPHNLSLNGGGLTFSPDFPCNAAEGVGLLPGLPSPDWALEENGVSQEYSFIDARDALRNGLTAQSAAEREKNLALLFRTLGQVLHHIQDMAQPQHTRNDPHGPWCFGVKGRSLYEEYTNLLRVRDALPYLGYDTVYRETDTTTFDTPRKFWTTSEGKGMADYSNRGFVSAGTNFDKYDPVQYPLPELGAEWIEDKTTLCKELYNDKDVPLPTGPAGQALPCVMTFISTYVGDSYRPGENALKSPHLDLFDL